MNRSRAWKNSSPSWRTTLGRNPSDPQTKNTFRPAVSDDSGNRISLGRWALRGFGGMLLAAGIGVAGVIWLG